MVSSLWPNDDYSRRDCLVCDISDVRKCWHSNSAYAARAPKGQSPGRRIARRAEGGDLVLLDTSHRPVNGTNRPSETNQKRPSSRGEKDQNRVVGLFASFFALINMVIRVMVPLFAGRSVNRRHKSCGTPHPKIASCGGPLTRAWDQATSPSIEVPDDLTWPQLSVCVKCIASTTTQNKLLKDMFFTFTSMHSPQIFHNGY